MLRILLLAMFLFPGCDLFTNHPDPSIGLSVTVLDSLSLQPIAGAVVALRDYNIPDSVYFSGDSVDTKNFTSSQKTNSYGGISLHFSQGRVAGRYQALFTYKEGFKLWRFDTNPIEITQPEESLDQAFIYLVPK